MGIKENGYNKVLLSLFTMYFNDAGIGIKKTVKEGNTTITYFEDFTEDYVKTNFLRPSKEKYFNNLCDRVINHRIEQLKSEKEIAGHKDFTKEDCIEIFKEQLMEFKRTIARFEIDKNRFENLVVEKLIDKFIDRLNKANNIKTIENSFELISSLSELFEKLEKRYLKGVNRIDFNRVFSGQPLNKIEKINWTGSVASLNYFLRNIELKSNDIELQSKTKYFIASKCFKIKGKEYSAEKIEYNNKPTDTDIKSIKPILEETKLLKA